MVTCQPKIRHTSGKVRQPKTDVVTTEPLRQAIPELVILIWPSARKRSGPFQGCISICQNALKSIHLFIQAICFIKAECVRVQDKTCVVQCFFSLMLKHPVPAHLNMQYTALISNNIQLVYVKNVNYWYQMQSWYSYTIIASIKHQILSTPYREQQYETIFWHYSENNKGGAAKILLNCSKWCSQRSPNV